MNEWITGRRPTEADAYKDAESVLYECVIVQGRDYKLYRKWYNVTSGEAWQCIPWENADEPIAKAKGEQP